MRAGDNPPGGRAFAASAFAPELPGTGLPGKLWLSASVLRFEGEQGKLELPVAGLQISAGGANDALICFAHPAHPETLVSTADRSVLQHPVLVQNAPLAQQGRRARSRARRASLALLTLLGVLVAAGVIVVVSRHWLVDQAAARVPVDWEIKAGDALFSQLIRTQQEITDNAITNQLARITGPLVAGINDPRYPFKFHIVADESLNAFALPGGNVVLHTGLLLAADSPEEVAGVLAHEIAHVTRRHSIRNLVSSAGLGLVLQSLVGDARGLLGALSANSELLLGRKFSRDFEREADETGWRYLVQSDIDPRGMIRFFERVRSDESTPAMGNGVSGALSMVSTHPATAERIAAAQARWRKTANPSGFRQFDLDYREFKRQLQTARPPASL